jgi:hypothetical protein
MSAKANLDVLSRQVAYSGEGISVKSLETEINRSATSRTKVDELKVLRERNVEIQTAMTDELKKLRKFSDYLNGTATKGGFWAGFKEVLSYIPGLRSLAISPALDRGAAQAAVPPQRAPREGGRRVRRHAQAERARPLQGDRPHQRQDRRDGEERARGARLRARAEGSCRSSSRPRSRRSRPAASRPATSRPGRQGLRQARRALDQRPALRLGGGALRALKENTRKLAETIRNLAQDIQQYTTAASIKLDMASAQIQAIGRAADASVVMLEMKRSLDVMTESMNVTTQFVSDTQIFFRSNLDTLVKELDTFDSTTEKVLDANLKRSKEIEEKRIQAAIEKAIQRAAATRPRSSPASPASTSTSPG